MTRAVPARARSSVAYWLVMVPAVLAVSIAGLLFISKADRGLVNAKGSDEIEGQDGKFRPTQAQWANLTLQPVEARTFRTEYQTEGKIAVDEDRSTPVFSLYAGRVVKLLAAPGDKVERGQPLFVLEATDSVQAQNDFIAAMTSLNKARSQVRLAETVERRMRNLYDAKAMPLKDLQQAEADLIAAQNDLRSAETMLEAMRNRLRILGKSDAEIDAFQRTGAITAETVVQSPLAGTIVLRKVGPGQYIAAGSADPVFVIGDLSTVWMIAFVRESDASKVKEGQKVKFSVLAHPDRIFEAQINYVPTALDPSTRRLLVRATIDNSEGLLKPEMFANVTILDRLDNGPAVAVPRDAIIYEGNVARVWVATTAETLESRRLKLGLSNGRMIQVLDGLSVGDRVVTRGSLFVDRASGS